MSTIFVCLWGFPIMSKWGFGYSAEVVELSRDCFQRIRSFLRLEIKFTYRTSSRQGNIRRGQIAKLFTNLPIFTVFQIFTDNSGSASTPSDIHNLVSISETFSAQFLLIKSLIIAINIFAVVHYPKILRPYFQNWKSCPQILLTFCASLTWNRNCPPLFNLKFFQAAARVWRRSALEIKIRFLGSPPGNFKTSHSPLSGLRPGLLAQGRDHKMKMATKQWQFVEIRIFSIHAEWFTLFTDWIFPNSTDFASF